MKHRLPRFLLRRLSQAVLIVVGIAIVNFLLVHLAPGDAVDVLAGESGAADAAYVAELRERTGHSRSSSPATSGTSRGSTWAIPSGTRCRWRG